MPALLLDRGRLVKTVRFKSPAYVGDPVNAVKIYNEKEVDELVVLDIGATPQGRAPDLETLAKLTDECFMPLAYGGGLRTLEQVRAVLGLGVEKVILNSVVAERPAFVTEVARFCGSQSAVVSMDVNSSFWRRRPQVYTRGGQHCTKVDPVAYARRAVELGAGELLVCSIEREGTWQGYDLELLKSVTAAVDVPVVALGGAGGLEHLRQAVKVGGASAVALGSMAVYQGKDLGVLINFPARAALKELFD